jgi:hypothetical protein
MISRTRMKGRLNEGLIHTAIDRRIKMPEGFHGNSVRLLQERNKQSVSLEYSLGKNIELDIDDKNHWAPRCVRVGTTALTDDELFDFLNKTENATFGFFIVKIKESNSI